MAIVPQTPALTTTDELRELTERVRTTLVAGAGFYLHRRAHGVPVDVAKETFLRLAESFGENVSRDAVGNAVAAAVIRSNLDPSFAGAYVGEAHSSHEIPLHSDGSGEAERRVRILGMFCEQAADRGGDTVLCDPWPVIARLTAPERALLAEPWPRRHPYLQDGPDALVAKPVLSSDAEGPCFSYGFQRLRLGLASVSDGVERERRRAVLEKLNAMLEATATVLRLADGDFILLDNCRLLHGRTRFVDAPGATRTLLRVWIGERVPPVTASPSPA